MKKFLRAALAWMERKFPDQLVVTHEAYNALQARLGALEMTVALVQSQAVHKDAVRDVIAVVTQVKDDIASFKASLGFHRAANVDPTAVFSGEYMEADNGNR